MIFTTVIKWIAATAVTAGIGVGAYTAFNQLNQQGTQAFDLAAALVPADTHGFAAFNTEVTSASWESMGDVLDRLGLHEDALEARDELFEDADLEYERDIAPVLAQTRALGIAGYATGVEDGDFAVVVDSRDPAAMIALLEKLAESSSGSIKRETSRDDARNLDVTTLDDGFDPVVVARRGDALFISDKLASIQAHIDRLSAVGPLSESDVYERLADKQPSDALILVYGSGSVLDTPELRDTLEALDTTGGLDAAGIDLAGMAMSMTLTTTAEGFSSRILVSSESGFGEANASLSGEAAVSSVAGHTPASAQLFFAALGLRETLEAWLDVAYVPGLDEFGFGGFGDAETEFASATGVDLRTDIIALLSGSFGAAGAVTDFDSPEGWVVFMTESTDAPRLLANLEQTIEAIEDECACDTDVAVAQSGPYVQVRWPSSALPGGGTLSSDDGFKKMQSRLQSESSGIWYLNLQALPAEARAQMRQGADGAWVDQLLGVGFSTGMDGELARVDMAVTVGDGR